MQLDPQHAALYTLIAICLVLIGAILTTGIVSIEQRAVALGLIFTTLLAVGYRARKNGGSGD